MIWKLWLRLATCLCIAVCLSLSAEEKKEREVKKKGTEVGNKAAKGKEKAEKAELKAEEKEEAEEVGKKAEMPDVDPADVERFRQRKDPAAVEIYTLYDEIDKLYTELRTATNVAMGDDKEARKAKTEVKALQGKARRQKKKLDDAVGKLVTPLERSYKLTKGKFDALEEDANKLRDKGQEKAATGKDQQAARLNEEVSGAEKTLKVLRSFQYFESADGLDLGGDDADDAKGGKSGRTDRGDKPRNGNRADKGDKGDKDRD